MEETIFKSNISRIRKTIMDYLKAEGTKVELENGLMVVELDECYYCIDFDLDDEYPKCEIGFRIKMRTMKHWNFPKRLSLQTR